MSYFNPLNWFYTKETIPNRQSLNKQAQELELSGNPQWQFIAKTMGYDNLNDWIKAAIFKDFENHINTLSSEQLIQLKKELDIETTREKANSQMIDQIIEEIKGMVGGDELEFVNIILSVLSSSHVENLEPHFNLVVLEYLSELKPEQLAKFKERLNM